MEESICEGGAELTDGAEGFCGGGDVAGDGGGE
jgi:hypothetical protein